MRRPARSPAVASALIAERPSADVERRGRNARRGAWLASAAITVAVFLQAPGRLVPETKLDLVVDPVDFLRRALHLWDPRAAFGQIQDQAAGYLFPMGPFYALGHALHIPMWMVQRAWVSLLIVASLWGVRRVAEALEIGSPATQLLAGCVYALSPAMLGGLAQASGGQLPAAVLPWAMLPLIHGARGGSARRAGAAFGIALLFMGGINAASFVGVLPVPALWLLTRRRGARRRRLMSWAAAGGALAVLWWVIPLALESRYGFNFRPYTETAAQTTATSSAVEVLRGTGYWLEYLFVHGPWLRGGWELVARPAAIIGSIGLAALGLGGLAHRELRERTFLIVTAAVGLALLCAGYGGPIGSPFAGTTRHFLDGSLSAFRNTYKFAPALRLPMALGAAHGATVAGRWLARVAPQWRAAIGPAGTVAGIALVALAALPLVDGHFTSVGSFASIPNYWRQTATWLATQGQGGRSVLVPASAFGEYDWGRPLDEPLQPLARSPWAVRDLIPLGSAGETRVLDAVEQAIDKGQPVAGLSAFLARAGVHYVVVRNDLDRPRTGAPAPVYVRSALARSGGFTLVAGFGPRLPSGISSDRLSPGPLSKVHAVEVYAVAGATGPVSVYPTQQVLSVSGGPEALLNLEAHGLVDNQPVVVAGDPHAGPLLEAASLITPVATDELRNREVDFGRVRDNFSYTLAPGRAGRDRVVVPGAGHRSSAVLSGAASITASSYGEPFRTLPEYQPYAAIDGNPDTAWVAGAGNSIGQWIEIRFDHPVDPRGITVKLLEDHAFRPHITGLSLATDRGTKTTRLHESERPQVLTAPPGRTRTLRLTITSVKGPSGDQAGIRDIAIPGLTVSQSIAVPGDQQSESVLAFDRPTADPFDPSRADEEATIARTFTLALQSDFALTGSAVFRPGPVLDQLLAGSGPVHVQASSSWQSLPAFRAANVVDGDPSTAWIASPDDGAPTLQLTWDGARTITGVHIVPAGGPTLKPTEIHVVGSDGVRTAPVGPDGDATFAPLATDHLTLTFSRAEPADPSTIGIAVPPAVGIADLRIHGQADLIDKPADPRAPLTLPCGLGPPVRIDDNEFPTTVTGTIGDAADLRPLAVATCGGPISLGAGTHRLTTSFDHPLSITGLTLGTPPVPTSGRAVTSTATVGPSGRNVTLAAGTSSVLVMDENFNAGFRATLQGERLEAVRIDGWRQGWVVPAGSAAGVSIRFMPDRSYRVGLLGGAAAVMLLVVLALIPARNAETLPETPPSANGRGREVLAVVGALALVAWLAGPLVFVVPVLLVLPERRRSAPWVAAGSMVLAGSFIALASGREPGANAGAFGAPAEVLAVLAIAVAFCALSRAGS